MARGLMRSALIALPRDERNDQFDEWIDHLRDAGDEGVQSLIVAIGLVVRGMPRLAGRSRMRQVFEHLVPLGFTGGVVANDGYKEGLWSPNHQTRVVLTIMRHLLVIGGLGTVSIIYDISIEPHQAPAIVREVYETSNRLERILVWLAIKLGCPTIQRNNIRGIVVWLIDNGLLVPMESLSETDRILDTAVRGRDGLLYHAVRPW
jgi:hypothetical protein